MEEEEEQENKQENSDKLQLPGIKRSTSHPGKVTNQNQNASTSDKKESTFLQIIEEEDGIETFRLDYEDSLRVSF